VVCFIDTAGAYPGEAAEKRGQSQAIAECIEISLMLTVPVITFIIGEGGSGGAVAMSTANEVWMLENSIYSVISPEGCASILWKSRDFREQAAEAQKLTAPYLAEKNLIHGIIEEPVGGAHRFHEMAIERVGNQLEILLNHYKNKSPQDIIKSRHGFFENIGRIK
jgi:acetyl-CoA carboxylase carboxyl transferase subunit alpha